MVKMILTYNTIACLNMMVDDKEEESATGQNTKVTLGEVGLNCIEQTLTTKITEQIQRQRDKAPKKVVECI